MIKVCISGFGDIGERVARRWAARGANVTGIKRTPVNNAELNNLPIEWFKADLDDPQTLADLPVADSLLYHLAPPPSQGQRDPRFRALLDSIEQNRLPHKVILLSTTAVYGDSGGEWIAEDAGVNPQTDRGRRRLDAEQALCQWAGKNGVAYTILRVSGIYGPDRLPLQRLQQGLPILREDLAPFSNRIHADDLAMVCELAADKAPDGAVYNVCDGKPSTMSHYFKSVARVFNLPMPPEVDMEEARRVLSAGMLSYLSESRRLSNRKMLDELGVKLEYPELEAGLISIRDSSS